MPMRMSTTTAAAEPTTEPKTATTTVELRKQLCQVSVRHMHTAIARGTIHPILVLAHVVALTSLRVGEDSISLHHKFELFFVSTLCVQVERRVTTRIGAMEALTLSG
jgi:hypothetical protein